jgi:UDP-N-acetylmuramoyl-L-alanyl-D-glutamate--2,6-diaminopimelate ligase
MIQESILDKILYAVKKLIPSAVFDFFSPMYHALLAYAGAAWYGFPSRSMKVIGVTGTKGKSTTVYLITKILEQTGHSVAAIGSLGYKIKDKEWPNTLKMSMPGRFRLQKFLAEAKKGGCEYVVLEVTSEGIKQKRHLGIDFDCAVFTNLHKEHLESHGSFENYYHAKQELFKRTKHIHVVNNDDPNAKLFGDLSAKRKIFYGMHYGEMKADNVHATPDGATFEIYGQPFSIKLGGEFNVMNVLAALATVAMYDIDLPTAKPTIENISEIPGRLQFVQRSPFGVVVDYAHTPDSLKAVYQALRSEKKGKLICVLGACGGGRDRWKRPEFGAIAGEYCSQVILTNEDPYDEDPEAILDEVQAGLDKGGHATVERILDRRQAIGQAIKSAQSGDTVVITGKGSETSMAVAGNRKVPWSDRQIVEDFLVR